MLKRKSKRFLSIILAAVMIVGLFPATAFADETETNVATELPPADANDVITLKSDVDISSSGYTVEGDITIDLAGYDLKVANTEAGRILVPMNTSLTLRDSSVNSSGRVYTESNYSNTASSGMISVQGGTFTMDSGNIDAVRPQASSNGQFAIGVFQGGSVIINGGKIEAGWYAISGNGTEQSTSTTITINGGTLVSTADYALYLPQNGVTTINDGIVTGAAGGIAQRSGKLIINGGTIASEGTGNTGDWGDGTGGLSDAAVNIGDSTQGLYGDVSVSITGGNFTAAKDAVSVNVGEDLESHSTNIIITGGFFADDVSEYIPDGNKWNSATGEVVIDETTAVASVNGVGYTSLQDAITAAPADGTVTLVRDFTLNAAPADLSDGQGAVLIAKNITIDGNNKTITAGSGFTKNSSGSRGQFHVFNIQNAGNVVIKNLTIEGKSATDGSVPRSGINIWSPTSATALTVENVTVNNCSTYGLTASGQDVDVVLNGLTTNGNAWGGVNIDTKNGGDVALTVNNADLNEVSSIVFDKGTDATKDPVATINGGSFENLVMNVGAENTSLLINGGTFNPDADKPSGGTAVDIEKHLAPGLEYNPVTGQVYKEPEYTGKYSYEIFTKVGDNGTIDVDRYATEGDEVTITVSPEEAYLLDEMTVTSGGKDVEVTDNGDGTYTFTMPSGDVKIEVTFAEDPNWEEEPAMPFVDVDENDWFYDVVLYAYENGLMTGTSADAFAPNTATTRGMIVSMLARLEGVTSAESAGFTDVAESDWYATAVNWAASEGIVNGFEDDTFRPNDAITREQMAAILYNYADYKGYDVSARADLSGYADAANISSWAEDVLAWANAEGLINGMTATTIDPQGATTRAQTAAMFERFLTAHAE
ncbi:MAG: S-layer homology domain-containing protein [Peptococcaceae bacterium]|nr:S-layer homology domain-containing protein [Peptococcaceae bacterium]